MARETHTQAERYGCGCENVIFQIETRVGICIFTRLEFEIWAQSANEITPYFLIIQNLFHVKLIKLDFVEA